MQKEILLKQVTVICPDSQYHNQRVDIYVKEGKINQIDKQISGLEDVDCLYKKGAMVSVGWLDMRVNADIIQEPYKEDLDSLEKAASKGGFTAVTLMPIDRMGKQSESDIKYLIQETQKRLVNILPTSCIGDMDYTGRLKEMKIAKDAGAVAVTNNKAPINSIATLTNALLYAKSFDILPMIYCDTESLSTNGLMHEGKENIKLGLKGMPYISESMKVYQIISLSKYYKCPIHLSNVSTKESMDIITKAKKEGVSITCDVNAYNLMYDDTHLVNFDTNCKVNPPFRSKSDIKALVKGVKSGMVDVVCSDHTPLLTDEKLKEFKTAKFGISSVETVLSFLLAQSTNISSETIVKVLSSNPRKILGLKQKKIAPKEPANLTVFDTNAHWCLDTLKSKSKNTPAVGTDLKGKVLATINNGKIQLH